MPRGPKGEKRLADVIANAIDVARIATGDEPDELTNHGKDKAAVSLGRRGGKARAEKLSPERRSEIAKMAASKRWNTK
ncbi:MAG: RNA-binding protein [Hyphomicrobiaceae bacterium]